MKIRIQGNKLRFRLKQFEVDHFRKAGSLKEVVIFGSEPSQQLQFVIRKGEAGEFSLLYANTSIELSIPAATAHAWTTTEMVGFEKDVYTVHGSKIIVLVEKDFACIDGKEEDNVGTYPNPRMSH